MDSDPTARPVTASADRLATALVHAGDDPFRAVIAATQTPIAITDPRQPDNPLIYVNDSFCAFSGYAAADLIGCNCRLLQGPDTDRTVVAEIRAAVGAGGPIERDILNYRKDGTAFWNRLAIAPVFDAAGGLTHFFASQQDVTAEREKVAALTSANASLTVESADRLAAQQATEARLQRATEAAAIGVWEITLPERTLTGTPTLNAVYGFPAGPTPTYDAVRAVAHSDDAARVVEAFDRAAAGEGGYKVTYRVMRADGTTGWVEVRGEVDRGPDGKPTRVSGVAQDITARRAAEEKLELSEQSLRLATDAANVGTWDLDLLTDTLTWSERTKAMFGISPDVPCSMADFYGGLHPDDSAATTAAFAAAVDPAVRASYDVEFRTIGKNDGVVRWVAARGKGLFDGGTCIRALGTAIDITRRRRAAERQAFLRTLSDALRDLGDAQAVKVAAMRALGREVGANRVGYGTVDDDDMLVAIETGYADGTTPIDGIFALNVFGEAAVAANRAGRSLIVADVTTDPRVAGATFAASDTRSFVSVALVRDGRFRASLFVNRATAGEWAADDVALIEAVAARTWDAVERARAEAERAAIDARLRAVVDSAPVGLIFATADGAIQGGNAMVEDLLRHPVLPSPDVAHYREYIAFHPDGRQVEGPEYPLARALAGEERPELEALYRRGDGTDAFMRFIAAPVRATDGKVVGGVVATLDIDRERRAEIALRDLNATLEQRVDERTAALVAAEDALRQAQKMEAVGQLTGGIAHDFNNMLAVVLGSLDLLGRRLSPGDLRARRYVDAATDGARRAATLTQRLLAFSRQQPLQPEPVDVNRLVSNMSDLLRGSLGGGIHLETVLAGGLWLVNADPNQLENVVLNLGINARDAMDGSGKVTIETHNCHLDDRYVAAEIGIAAGQYVMIAVTDTGAGMSPEVVAKAFDPFFTTKGVGKGTGLGLSQVYGFVKQSGGHVKLYSETGVGTTVKLYLPRLISEATATESALDLGPPPGGDLRELILVVEDEPGVREVSVEALRELGYSVLEADGAEMALRLLKDYPGVALLFTDVVMPEVNGARLADAARALRPGLKVLFTTGYTRNAVVHNGVVDAGVELIGKPFTVAALATKVRAVLDG